MYFSGCLFYWLELGRLLLSMMNQHHTKPFHLEKWYGQCFIHSHSMIRCNVHNNSTIKIHVWKELHMKDIFIRGISSLLWTGSQESFIYESICCSCVTHNETSSSSHGSRQCCFCNFISSSYTYMMNWHLHETTTLLWERSLLPLIFWYSKQSLWMTFISEEWDPTNSSLFSE